MQDLTANLFDFQKSGYLCDTLILADDGQVKAHSTVLAAASPVFKQVLKSSYQPLPHIVVLPGIQLLVVNIIIQFMYTGKIIVPRDNRCSSTKVIDAIRDLGIKLHIARCDTKYITLHIKSLCIYEFSVVIALHTDCVAWPAILAIRPFCFAANVSFFAP